MNLFCSKCNQTKPETMFKCQSRDGRRKQTPNRQCLDCLRAWFTENARKRRREKGKPPRSDPIKMAETVERKKKRNKARSHITNAIRRGGVRCVPKWGQDCIADVYTEARYMQMEVDHIVPLKSPLVCGLHVWDNLQLLTPSANRRKHRKFDPVTFIP